MLIVLTGKTASGKDAVIAELLKKMPNFKKVLTTTSRNLREGEVNGVDYNFISGQDFRQKIENGEFLEYVSYGGNLYGTEKKEFENKTNLIWKIDPSMAGKAKSKVRSKKVKVIYLTTNDETVLQRLKERGLTGTEIEKRMRDDKRFWEEYKDNYDYVIENIPGKLDETVDKIVNLIKNSI